MNLFLQIVQTISIIIICKEYNIDLLKKLKQSLYIIISMNVLFSILFPSLALSKVLGEDGRFDALTPSPNNLAQLAVIAISIWLPRSLMDYKFKTITLIGMSIFCLYLSGSATGLVSIVLVVFINLSLLLKRRLMWSLLIGVGYISFFVLQIAGVGEDFSFFKLLNRDANLTGRTLIWNYGLTEIIKDDRVAIGYGAGGFWDPSGKRVHIDPFMDNFMQMHNGYIETYMQLGYFGIALLILLLFIVVPLLSESIKYHSLTNFSLVVIIILINNLTESSFLLPKHPNWIIFTLLYSVISLKLSNQYRGEIKLKTTENKEILV
ncbi:O-antigen ligase family protein [Spirosoma lituiforme]